MLKGARLMSDREDQEKKETKPWEKTFSDDQDKDQEGNFSRTRRRKQNSYHTMFTTILVVAIIALASAPIIYWVNHQSSFNHPTDTEQVADSSSSKKKSSANSAKTSVETSKVTSSKKASATSKKESSASSSSADEKYVTVEAGQGAYRVAVNNGITVDELYQLNGLSSGATLTPGQQIRVK